jgi:hypothetical protein
VSERKTEADRRHARYRAQKAAEDEVTRRLSLAVGRIAVADSMTGWGAHAQSLHAVHYVQRGWADDSRTVPPEAPYFSISHDHAERIVAELGMMFVAARAARLKAGDAS